LAKGESNLDVKVYIESIDGKEIVHGSCGVSDEVLGKGRGAHVSGEVADMVGVPFRI